MKPLFALIVFATAQFFLRPEPPPRTEGHLVRRFPGVVHSAILGGFRPLLVQYLWWDLEEADAEGRHHDILRNLALLQEVEPRNARAAIYMGHFLAHSLSAREPTLAGRLRRIEEAVELLERAEDRIPGEAALSVLHGRILADEHLWSDNRLYRLWSVRHQETPFAGASRILSRAVQLDPARLHVRRLLAHVLRMRAIEMVLAEGNPQGAVSLLEDSLREVALGGGSEGASGRLSAAWSRVVTGLSQENAALVAPGLAALAGALEMVPPPSGGGDGREERLARAILRPAIELGRREAASGDPAVALSLAVAAHNIQGFAAERLGAGDDPALREELRALVKTILTHAPQLEGRVPDPLR